MTKSNLDLAMARLKEALLPDRGAEFVLRYWGLDGEEVVYGEKPHISVSAASAGLSVSVIGEDTKVLQNRQMKPVIKDGIFRTMLVIEIDGVFIHILGDQIAIARRRIRIPEITGEHVS